MRLGPLLFLVWLLSLLAACAAPVVHLVRHRSWRARGLGRTLLAPAGGVMTILLWVLYVGLTEGAWAWSSLAAWTALALGAAGFPLIALGWRAALRPRIGPGQCPRCGYAMEGLAVCPECGPGVISRTQSSGLKTQSPDL